MNPDVRCPECFEVLAEIEQLENKIEYLGNCETHGRVRTARSTIYPDSDPTNE